MWVTQLPCSHTRWHQQLRLHVSCSHWKRGSLLHSLYENCHAVPTGGFFLVILLFKVAPGAYGRRAVSCPQLKNAVMCLTKKIQVSGKLCSGLSYRAVGREFNVNEWISSILKKMSLTHRKQGHTLMGGPEVCVNLTLYLPYKQWFSVTGCVSTATF